MVVGPEVIGQYYFDERKGERVDGKTSADRYLLDEALRIELSILDAVAVQDVAAEGGDFNGGAVAGGVGDTLSGARPGFGVLAGHASDTDDAAVGAPDEDKAHLQQQLDLGLDDVAATVVEQLCTVTPLQQEGLSPRYISQALLQPLHLGSVY